ncbi:hypothetical protein [Mesorhizobium captivum]|nr:hypothetical protein [Mesorhizobium sp. VK23E]MDX8514635.1 hypothetical protein [Mesorhizobium sp. VK23E]
MAILVNKSSVHFRAGFEPIALAAIFVATALQHGLARCRSPAA